VGYKKRVDKKLNLAIPFPYNRRFSDPVLNPLSTRFL
jgi:hypothetical protein